MMNQAASATRRPSSASTATAGCCPMIVHPQFFMNTFAAQAPLPPPAVQQCLLGSHLPPLQPQTALTSTNTTASTNAAQLQAPQANGNNTINGSASTNEPSATQLSLASGANISQQQPHQAAGRQDQQAPNNYNSSTSLAHLLSNPHLNNCMALAATLATLHQTQQLQHAQHQHHHHQTTPINHPQQQQQPQPNPSGNQNVATNQVPLLNFNSYTSAPFLNNASPPTQQPAPAGAPLAAHLSSSQQQQQATTNLATSTTTNSNAVPTSHTSQPTHYPGQRPLAINTTLNSVANQQQQISYRPNSQLQQQQTVPTLTPPQIIRSLVSEEFSNLVSEHFSTLVFNQILASGLQFAQPVNPNINSNRTLAPNAVLNQQAASVAPSHPPAPQQQLNQQQQSIPPPLPTQLQQSNDANVREQHTANRQPQQPTFQSQTNAAQARLAQVPQPPVAATVPPLDTYASTATTTNTNPIYQQQQQHLENPQAASNPASEPEPPLQSSHPQQTNASQQQQPPPQQHQQQHTQSIPPPPPLFYGFNTMNQALALLASTSQVQSQNMLNQIFNLYLQNGLTSDTHLSHHAHHPPHHYHHHLHGSHHHHHHHHGPNGQNNGQDDTMLTISESKPKGLSRADIDSLTPYIQMNEKDSRTCVICLSRFELKSKIRPLPCNHAFHAKCVDKWLRANRTCPICRRDAMKTYGAKIKRI